MLVVGGRLLLAVLCFCVFGMIVQAQDSPPPDDPQTGQGAPNPDGDARSVWTRWHPQQYALAEEEQAIWIGAAGGVVRLDKATLTHQRFMAPEGLPHQDVRAVAVDGSGNRWFGGDGGLSRLDAGNSWTHFTTANSGLHENRVDAIAVGPGDVLWLGHGLPDGGVSRYQPDGAWGWYPNRTAAVAAEYALVAQTANLSRLWTVAGEELWVDYQVYDGATWTDRTPPNSTSPPTALVTTPSTGAVYAVERQDPQFEQVLAWENGAWSTIYSPIYTFGAWTVLATDANEVLWGGGTGTVVYGISEGVIGQIGDPQTLLRSGRPGPVAALLSGPDAPWALGPT
jgi:hypothetical protein